MSQLALATSTESNRVDDNWWIDSGATQHMTPEKDGMQNFVEFGTPRKVQLAENSILHSYGKGDLKMTVYDGSKEINLNLSNVLYVPKIKKKLLSLPTLTEKGAEVRFKEKSFIVILNGEMYCIGHKAGKMYKLNAEPIYESNFASINQTDDLNLWHYRIGNLGYDNVKLLYNKSMVDGLKLNPKQEIDRACDGCAMGKFNRLPFPKKSDHGAEQLLGIIHSDVCGPFSVQSIGGSRYFVTFIDDYSRYTKVFIMKNKGEVLDKFKEFVNLAENVTGQRVKVLRSDNGGEYGSKEFIEFCKSRGIKKQITVPYTPQQNGVAERMNRTIVESVRSMLHKADLPLSFWAEAVATAVFLRNRSPTIHVHNATPFECYYSRKPDVSFLRVFGCNAYVHVPEEKRKKLDKKSEKCIFIGYPNDAKGYKFYNPATKKMLLSYDALFLEDTFYKGWSEDAKKVQNQKLLDEGSQLMNDVFFNDKEMEAVDQDAQIEHPREAENINYQPEVIPRRSGRRVVAPDRLDAITGDWWNVASVAITEEEEPKDMKEAMNSSKWSHWKEATDNEYKSLKVNKTWDLVKMPKDKNIVTCKWVFKVKRKADGSIDRYKARLVAQGYSQEPGQDYDDTYAAVARFSSLRSLLAIAVQPVQLNLEVHQMDVRTAFLNGDLEHEIYMEQPEGYEDEEQPDFVCKLRKSLYGLKQSARCWNVKMDSFLKASGYNQSTADPCMYQKSEYRDGKQCLMLIAFYVDDIVLATNDTTMLNNEKNQLMKRFEIEDQGEIHHCLGMCIKRDRSTKTMHISQKAYLENILKRFNMSNCKPVSTPMEVGKKYEKLKDGEQTTDLREYQCIIGSLMYAAIATRPDIAFSVGMLSQYMSNPGEEHFRGIKRVLRYLRGTTDFGLEFKAQDNMKINLHGYADADWAGDVSTRKSKTGHLFQIGNGTVSWKTRRQSIVALSSTEAEYVSLSCAAQETIWMRHLLESIGFQQLDPTMISEDNQGAIALAGNPGNHPRTKHISIKYHFIREAVEKTKIMLQYCPTKEMLADILTKALTKERFQELRDLIGVRSSH